MLLFSGHVGENDGDQLVFASRLTSIALRGWERGWVGGWGMQQFPLHAKLDPLHHVIFLLKIRGGNQAKL